MPPQSSHIEQDEETRRLSDHRSGTLSSVAELAPSLFRIAIALGHCACNTKAVRWDSLLSSAATRRGANAYCVHDDAAATGALSISELYRRRGMAIRHSPGRSEQEPTLGAHK